MKHLEILDVHFHTLLHTFATQVIEEGINPKTVSDLLGHSSVSITLDRFVHPSEEEKRKCMNIYSSLVSGGKKMNVINLQDNFVIKFSPSEYSIIFEISNAGLCKTREDYYKLFIVPVIRNFISSITKLHWNCLSKTYSSIQNFLVPTTS